MANPNDMGFIDEGELVAILRFCRRHRLPCAPYSGCVVVQGAKVKTLAEAKAAAKPYLDGMKAFRARFGGRR